MIRRGIVRQRLVAVFILGCLLLSYPLLAIFDRPALVAGIPLLYAYVFAVWMLFVIVLALTIGRRR